MTTTIRALAPDDIDAVVALSLRAWAPVFASFEAVLGAAIYRRVYPDWRTSQAQAVAAVCRDEAMHVLVAGTAAGVAGFAAVTFGDDPNVGEIEMLAVDPDAQRGGIGSALTDASIDYIRGRGARLAVVGTGGDPGHAPARRTYERSGFTGLPLVRYYQAL